MIQFVDRAVEQFFRQAVPLAESAVDVSFDAPDRTWGASVTRPTVNVFLWEVVRNPSFAHAGLLQREGANGRVERRPTSPVVDLHYLVTAWASEQRDEHQLLGSILETVLAHSKLPAEAVPEQLSRTPWISLALAVHEKRSPGEFWSALDGRLKPGLELEVTLPLDVFNWKTAAPVTESVGVEVNRMAGAPQVPTKLDETRPLRRRRANGALVMEGRPADVPADAPVE